MIELELKFQIKKIPANIFNYPIIEEREVNDIYYDTLDYELLKKGNFLRCRNSLKIDFKTSMNDLSHLYCKETSFSVENMENSWKQINELLSVLEINEEYYYQGNDNFLNNFKVLAPIKKKRTGFKINDELLVYIDEVEDLGLFLEAEIDIDSDVILPGYAKTKRLEILDLLQNLELINKDDISLSIGYVELYLKKYNYDVYLLGLYQE